MSKKQQKPHSEIRQTNARPLEYYGQGIPYLQNAEISSLPNHYRRT